MALLHLSDGGTMFYDMTDKAKPPILFQHGWAMGESSNWELQKAVLKDKYNVITVDFRGHGASSKDRKLGVPIFAKDIRQLIEHLDLRDLVIVGHSMGALTLLQYIDQYGTAGLKKIVIVDQSPKLMTDDEWHLGIYGDFTEATNNRFVAALHKNYDSTMVSFSQNALRDDLDTLAVQYKGPFYFPKHILPNVMIDIWDTIIHCDFRHMLHKIDIPTLLTYGRNSQFYLNETAHYMQQHIAQAKLVFFENSRHAPPFEEPDAFNHALLTFLAE